MLQGVVVEVLNDPSFYSDDQLLEIFNNIANTSCLSGDPTQQAFIPDQDSPSALRYLIPRGSLLVKIVSEGLGKASDTNHLCFPFFPPHLQLPIKPGERVWVFSDKPGQNLTNVYWMCRITAPGFVDDINYTHIDRSILPSPGETPSFPNGNDTADKLTIPDAEGFENIVKEIIDSESFTMFSNPSASGIVSLSAVSFPLGNEGVSPGFVDDINYTHIDRSILPSPGETPSFPNGNDTADRLHNT